MNLFSLEFLILISISYIAYYVLPKRFQWCILLLTSLVFYAFSGWTNLIFIGITSFTSFYSSFLFDRIDQKCKESIKDKEKEEKKALKAIYKTRKRVVLWTTVILNFGMLSIFKYLPDILGAASGLGLLLPLGISFYTFQAMGYVIDRYNGKYEGERSYPKFLLFVSFFPQLIQGPINRFDQLSEKLFKEHSFDFEAFKEALLLIAFGLMKKYAIANVLSEGIAFFLDAPKKDIPGSVVVTAILMYSAQQYADFSGGIDIVLGIAKLFGIEMAPNFKQPYFAISLADFWRRWHISLGAWMKDYVFYPFALTSSMQKLGKASTKKLGRETGRLIPACIGNILVFLIVGIWHGARLHYILWGLYNGLVIAASELLEPLFSRQKSALKIDEKSAGFHIFRIIRTFIIVNIGWYFDRIEGFWDTMICFKNTLVSFEISRWKENMALMLDSSSVMSIKTLLLCALAILATFAISLIHERGYSVYGFIKARPAIVRYAMYFVILAFLQVAMSVANASTPFMYAVF